MNPSYWFGRTTSVSGTSRFRILLGKAFSTSIAKSTFSKKERNSRSAKRIAIITEGTTFKREVKHLRGLKARNVFQGCARGGCQTSFLDLDVFFSFSVRRSRLIKQSTSHLLQQSVRVRWSISQSVSQSVNQSDNQPVHRSINHSDRYSIS